MAEPDRQRGQLNWLLLAGGVAFLFLGLTLAVGSVLVAIHQADHWRALQTSGTAVQASVEQTAAGGTKSTDRIRIGYDFAGKHYDTWTPCAGLTGCRQWPGPQITIWLDPANPADFVKDSENSSRWVSVRNVAVPCVAGIALAAMGGFCVYAGISNLRGARRRQAAVARRSGRPSRRRR
jgi:hypothetical protein